MNSYPLSFSRCCFVHLKREKWASMMIINIQHSALESSARKVSKLFALVTNKRTKLLLLLFGTSIMFLEPTVKFVEPTIWFLEVRVTDLSRGSSLEDVDDDASNLYLKWSVSPRALQFINKPASKGNKNSLDLNIMCIN